MLTKFKIKGPYIPTIIIVLILSFLLTKPVIKIFNLGSLNEPTNKTYVSDEMSFLKTFYYMKTGLNYYQSFKLARHNLNRTDDLSNDISLWRLPTIFYTWSLFTNDGNGILALFIFLSLLSIISVFLIAKKLSNNFFGILSAIFLTPYFLDTLRYKTAFLFIEWWALFFYIFGLTFLIYKKNLTATIFFSLCIMTRELFVIPIFLIFIFHFLKKKDYKLFILPFLSFGLLYFFHQYNINLVLGHTEASLKIIQRLHSYSIKNLQETISFSMRNYALFGLKTHYVFILMGLSFLLASLYLKPKVEILYLLISASWGLVILPTISVQENDYWGIMFTPFLVMSAPLLIYLLLKIKPLYMKHKGWSLKQSGST